MNSRSPQFVIMIGPDPVQVGGMASVVSQLLGMDLDGRFGHKFLPLTYASRDDERPLHRTEKYSSEVNTGRPRPIRKSRTVNPWR